MRKKRASDSVYQEIVELLTIFIRAVRKAQEENLRLGLPNVYCEGGRIFYQLPNGRITDVLPKNLLRVEP